MAAEWQAATKLPFAFAVWVARKGTPYEVIESLQHALTFGLEHTYEAILEAGFDKKPYDAYEYLTRNIAYIFANQKRRAPCLDQFTQKATRGTGLIQGAL